LQVHYGVHEPPVRRFSEMKLDVPECPLQLVHNWIQGVASPLLPHCHLRGSEQAKDQDPGAFQVPCEVGEEVDGTGVGPLQVV